MADSDFSQVFRDQESDEISLETSVPTDTLSPERDDRGRKVRLRRDDRISSSSANSKYILEKKQLLHDLQLYKIELSQRDIAIDNLKAQQMQKTDELEEKLNEALYQKQILQVRLESELRLQQDESKRYQESMRKQLEDVVKKQQKLEASNAILREKASDVKNSLICLDLTEEQYHKLRSQNEDTWSLRDYVAVKLLEKKRPLQNEIQQLKRKLVLCESEQKSLSEEVALLQKNLDEERISHSELRINFQKVSSELSDCQAQVQTDTYRISNFDSIKSERDTLQKEHCELKRQNLVFDSSNQVLQKERDEISRQLASCKQEVALLTQDKNYLTRQVSELTNRCSLLAEKIEESNLQLENAKKSREEMYEKYVSSRDLYKCEYENKLKDELETIRAQTNSEIERLRTSTKELYERENSNLREAREMAILEKEKFESSGQELNAKYEQLLNEYRTLQMSGEQRLLDLQTEAKLKAFEAERSHLAYEETCRNLKEYQLEIEKLEAKYEVLLKEYYAMEAAKSKKIAELESEMSSKNIRLDSYDKIEQELDDLVLQAAEIEDETNAEKVLLAYGTNMGTNTKRRLKQSVDLAKRVLLLERTNATLKQELVTERKTVQEKADEVKSCKELLESAQQPQSYLIESIQSRDELLKKRQKGLQEAEQQIGNLQEERLQLIQTQNQMSEDIERLLSHQAEIALIKQILAKMSMTNAEVTVAESATNIYKPGSISYSKT